MTIDATAPLSAPDFYQKPEHGWTCFHCGETFTTLGTARDHFGHDPLAEPGCRIKVGAERGLLMALRRAEKECADAWQAIHNETTDAAKAYHAASARHVEQLRTVEEAGYERGLRDGATQAKAELGAIRIPQLLPGEPVNTVLDEIATERRRQDAKYGGPGNDDGHAHGALVIAGAVYALDAVQGYYSPDVTVIELSSDMLRKHSPCGHNQADDARRRLVKAAALLVAEIERLDRAEPTTTTPTDAEIEELMGDDGGDQ